LDVSTEKRLPLNDLIAQVDRKPYKRFYLSSQDLHRGIFIPQQYSNTSIMAATESNRRLVDIKERFTIKYNQVGYLTIYQATS
jgi:hypothetical protein